MNYSKKGIEYKQQSIKSTSRRLVSKTRIALFRFLFAFLLFAAVVGVFAGVGFIKGLIDSAPDISQIDVIPTGYTTTVYDRDGNEIEHLIGAHSNRVYVGIDQIPKVAQQAFVSIEDERFYEHDGIDVKGIFRAAVIGLTSREFDQGASTITQQLLKNQVFDGGREKAFTEKVKRKIQEQYLAIQLENKLDKDEILEYYLNTINLGSGTYGVQTAARRYFNKDISEITLSEAAVIAAIAQLPVWHNPITYPEKNAERRNLILDKMLKFEYCTQAEYEAAKADDVYARIQSINEDKDTNSFYSYFVDELIEQVMEDLQSKLGYTQTQAQNLIYSGGLSIYTTQDSTIQDIVDSEYEDEENFPDIGTSLWELTYALSIQKNDADKTTIHYHGNDLLEYYKDFKDPDGLYINDGASKFSLLYKDKDDMKAKIDEFRDAMVEEGDTILGENITMTIQPQSSFIVMDQYSGHVVALIGGRGPKTGNRTLNRATNTVRQPGSTFKILSTYLPAIDTGKLTLAGPIDDSGPYYYPGTEDEVNNWTTKKSYEGLTTLRRGIYNSMNIVTVKVLDAVTPQIGYEYLLKLGFTSMVESRVEADGRVFTDIKLPMALGGLTDGVSNLELTAAYAAIANGGVYTEPFFYTKVLDHDGKILLDNTQAPKTEQVMKSSSAFLLTNAMEDVIKKGTGTAYSLNSIKMPVAGKTGSTSDYNDLWFSGFTPYYTATIWAGFDNNRPQSERRFQRDLWRTIMEQVHTELNLETKSFTIPDSITTAKVCSKSGKLAVEGLCDHYLGGSTVYTEYFAKGTEPKEKCDIHVKATICKESHKLATEYCPLGTQEEAVYLNKTELNKTDDSQFLLPSETCTVHNADSSSIFYDDSMYEDDPLYEDEPLYNNSLFPEVDNFQINDYSIFNNNR